MPKANTASASDLSELEGGVLGIVHTSPDSTAHVIREMFRHSRSSHWSGSAGAIYPLMKKLEGRGLLAVKEAPRGRQVRRTYTITADGLRELRRWIGPPVDDWMASVTFDPIRTRMPFLQALSPAKQLAFLEDAERKLEAEVAELKKEHRKLHDEGDFWERMSADGCLSTNQARLRWVKKTLEAARAR